MIMPYDFSKWYSHIMTHGILGEKFLLRSPRGNAFSMNGSINHKSRLGQDKRVVEERYDSHIPISIQKVTVKEMLMGNIDHPS